MSLAQASDVQRQTCNVSAYNIIFRIYSLLQVYPHYITQHISDYMAMFMCITLSVDGNFGAPVTAAPVFYKSRIQPFFVIYFQLYTLRVVCI
jgi:hypothetical protein